LSVFRCLYQVLMFALSYAIPLIIVGVLLGVTLLHWLCSRNVSPQSATSAAAASAADSSTSPAAGNVGRHATRVVVVVVVVFAILELPLQVGLRCQISRMLREIPYFRPFLPPPGGSRREEQISRILVVRLSRHSDDTVTRENFA